MSARVKSFDPHGPSPNRNLRVSLEFFGQSFRLGVWLLFAGLASGNPPCHSIHVHIAVPNPAESAQWYAGHLSGSLGPSRDRVFYDKTIVAFQRVTGNRQSSAGSAVDHIGITIVDLPVKLKELQSVGAKVLQPLTDVRVRSG